MKYSILIAFFFCLFIGSCSNEDDPQDVITQPQSNVDLSDDDELAIFNIRLSNNEAIARHDAATVAAPYIHNFFILTSTNGYFEGKETVQNIYQSVFDGRDDVVFIRTPDIITTNLDWNMASEYGTWTGSWKVEEEEINVGGDYYAKWHKIQGLWKLRSEVYTQFDCTGDVVCDNKPMLE